jgi:TRAP-type mannitol/chloroaromatic compound transport system substrate-binding protein
MLILSKFQAINNSALQKLVNDHGVKLNNYGDELINAIGSRAPQVMTTIAAKSADAKSLYNHIVKFRSTMVDWANYSEGAFIKARVAANFKPV